MTTTPAISIVIVSHNKPLLLPEAIQSVLQQTHQDWEGILIDSGKLYDAGYFASPPWVGDGRLRVIRSHETPVLRRTKAMAPWCLNESFRNGWVRGELVMYLCDDDILYPNAFATFVAAFAANPSAMAMYASQDKGWVKPDGSCEIVGERRAIAPGGKSCNGRIMDCQVDYLQLCHRRRALEALPPDEYWPEAKATGGHADGLFMEKLGEHWPILPLDVKVSQNRRTPWSINLPARQAEAPPDVAVHESIVDAWTALKGQLNLQDHEQLRMAADSFQAQLRLLCEQEHAQRMRLVSRRYRLADQLRALIARPWARATGSAPAPSSPRTARRAEPR